MDYKELFKIIFLDRKKLSNKEILDIYETFDYKNRLYFTAFCQKNLKEVSGGNYIFNYDSYTSFYQDMEYRKKKDLDYKEFADDYNVFSDIVNLTKEEKEKLLEISSYQIENRGNGYWAYHGYNNHAIGKINRNFAIKIGISAHSYEDSEKIYKVLMPYLIENEKDICFKMPFKYNIERHLNREIEGNLITIYTLSDMQAITILKDLNSILEKANLDVKTGTNKAYVEVGNSGLVSAIIDSKPYSTEYIPRTTDEYTVGRNLREDNFERLKHILEENNLIYGNSIKNNDKKEKELKFGKYRYLKPKITLNDIKEIEKNRQKDKLAFIFGTYNIKKEDLPIIFHKEYGITDNDSFATLRSYNYSTFDCLELLSISKRDNLYSLKNCRSLNFLDDIKNNEEKYFTFLNNLYIKSKDSFVDFYNFIVEALIIEENILNRKNDFKPVNMNPFIKKHFDFLLDKVNDTNFPENKFFYRIVIDYINEFNNSLNKLLFDKNIYDRKIGQKEIDSLIFRTIRSKEDILKIEERLAFLKDIGFEFTVPDTNDFIEKFSKSSKFEKEMLIEDILENDTYYAYLHKNNFDKKVIENIDLFIKELSKEKINIGHIMNKYIEIFNEEKANNYKLFINKAFEADIIDLNSFKTGLEYRINENYANEDKLLYLYNIAKNKGLEINIYNYNFEKLLK